MFLFIVTLMLVSLLIDIFIGSLIYFSIMFMSYCYFHVNCHITIVNITSFSWLPRVSIFVTNACLCYEMLMCSCYMFSLVNTHGFFSLIYILIILMSVLWNFGYYLLFTNLFCLLKLTDNNKKRKFRTSDDCGFNSYFWYDSINFHSRIFASMLRFKLLDFFLHKHVIITNGMIRNDPVLLIYGLWKKNSVKIAARSSIFPAFQTKINLKVTASR